MSSPSSLRESYVPPPTSWSFAPAPGVSSGVPNETVAATGPAAASYQWATRPAQNSIFDMSPSLALGEPASLNGTLVLKGALASIAMQYTSAAIAMPWDVAKLLLQVQWVPRDAEEMVAPAETEEDQEASEESSNEDDSYFVDPNSSGRRGKYPKSRPSDERGYVVRRSVLEEATRPEYIIPVGSADGAWSMIKKLGRFRGEGWLSLWKGLLTSCIHDVLSTTLQPIIHGSLQALLLPSLYPYSNSSILIPLASHVVTGVLLSPLDLVRTRLIVQSSFAQHRRYAGPIDAFGQIIRDEGGVAGLYFHPQLLIPTLLDTTLTSLSALALPGLLARSLGAARIAPDTHPIAWGLAELAGSCIGLLATLPFETVRRRLQVQTRGRAQPLRTCVETRPAPYNGVVDTLWHILTEERSDLPIKRHSRRRRLSATAKGKGKDVEGTDDESEGETRSWWRNTGLGQLYRGMGIRLSASALVFLLASVSGGNNSELGWTEL